MIGADHMGGSRNGDHKAALPTQHPAVLLVLASAELYGSDRAALEIASAVRNEGLPLGVIVPSDGPLVDELVRITADVHVLDPLVLRRADFRGARAPATVSRCTHGLLRLRRFARLHRFDLVHTNCSTPQGGALLARWWNVPHLWQVHEIFGDALTRSVFGRLLRRADMLIGASEAVAAQFKDPELRSRFRVAYTGARVARVAESVPLASGEPLIACVGRLSPGKGQEILVDAIALLRQRGVPSRALLVGDVYGHESRFRRRLESRIAHYGLEDFISLVGERRDALELMAQSDIVAIPSVHPESFGMVVIEAMALGRPVVAADAGGPSEIITDSVDGLLVPAGDARALAAALERLVRDPVAARFMGETARVTACRFSPDTMTAAVLAAYRDLMPKAHDGGHRLLSVCRPAADGAETGRPDA